MSSDGSISRDQSPQMRDLTRELLTRLIQDDSDGLTPQAVCEQHDFPGVSEALVQDLLDAMAADPACPLEQDDGRVFVDNAGVDEYRHLLRDNDTDPFEQVGRE